jgi:hypothetical protein
MPAPYLSYLDLQIMVARAERRLAAARSAFGDMIRWGMEEAAWMTLEGEALPTLGEFRERRVPALPPSIFAPVTASR